MSNTSEPEQPGESIVPGTRSSKSLPGRTLSRKSSMGLDREQGYDFSFSMEPAANTEGDEEAPQTDGKYISLQKYMLSTGGKWSKLFHAFWVFSFGLAVTGVIVATLVVPEQFVVRIRAFIFHVQICYSSSCLFFCSLGQITACSFLTDAHAPERFV